MNTITISKNKLQKEGGMVILSLNEYRRLSRLAVPSYYLKGSSAKRLDTLVKEGIKNYRAGKTKILKSLADLD